MSFDFDEQDIGINIASNHVTDGQQPEQFSPTQEVERKALQESKQVVEAFLKRSLSQNAKSSLNSSLKPEGYHKLKKDGRLAYYQRQQSKPEHGNFTRGPTEKRHRSSASAQRNTVKQGLPLRSSLNELSSASNVKFESISRSVDGITDDTQVEDGILKKLLNSDQSLEHLPSSDSLQSGGDDGSLITRRRSFTRAVTRKSVISIIETKHRDRHSSSEKRVKSDLKYTSKTPDPIRKTYSLKTRKGSLGDLPSSHSRSSSKEEEDALKRETGATEEKKVGEKKISFKERMRRIMGGPSNKKKLRYKKSYTQRQVSSEESKKSEENSAGINSQGFDFSSGSSKHPSRERTPSPSKKGSSTPNVFRSFSLMGRPSPKPKHRTMPSSNSSSNFDAYSTLGTGALSRDKSGSLPASARLGVIVNDESLGRRHSSDVLPKDGTHRPHHLDLHKKHNKGGKWRKWLKFMRRRHDSESSNSSRSLPSIPAALADEGVDHRPEPPKKMASQTKIDDVIADGDTSLSFDGEAPYHHRGSLSFSSGDLDGLSMPEKQEIYDEIAETLQRISQKFNLHVQSRSSTPGSRIVTPESSFSSHEYRQYMKARSDPVSRQSSVTSGQSSMTSGQSYSVQKSFRKYKDDTQPALTAYMNLSQRQRHGRTSDPLSQRLAAKMPRTTPVRRHTHHAKTGSFDSPYNQHKVTLHRASKTSAYTELRGALDDVVDGEIPETEQAAAGDAKSSFDDDVTSKLGKVPAGDLLAAPRRHSECPPRHGSDVDDPSYLQRYAAMEADRASTSARTNDRVIDEDKLVDQLVEALILKGQHIEKSIDMPDGLPMEPAFRNRLTDYMTRVSYQHFQNKATRFCWSMRQLVEAPASSHSEVFPVVMLLNMTRMVVDIVVADQTRQAVNNVLDFSTRFVTQLVQETGQSWDAILDQLLAAEVELAEVTPLSEASGGIPQPPISPRKSPRVTGTDNELD